MVVQSFSQLTGLKPVNTGIWLSKTGVLGSLPDGLVGEDSVLEVKCPYTTRNSSIVDATETANFCLTTANGVCTLKLTMHIGIRSKPRCF